MEGVIQRNALGSSCSLAAGLANIGNTRKVFSETQSDSASTLDAMNDTLHLADFASLALSGLSKWSAFLLLMVL